MESKPQQSASPSQSTSSSPSSPSNGGGRQPPDDLPRHHLQLLGARSSGLPSSSAHASSPLSTVSSHSAEKESSPPEDKAPQEQQPGELQQATEGEKLATEEERLQPGASSPAEQQQEPPPSPPPPPLQPIQQQISEQSSYTSFHHPSTSRLSLSGSLASFWPEECIERVAHHLAAETAHTSGPLSAGPALATLFQVCTSWRAVSYSETLWRSLASSVWNQERLIGFSWQETYVRLHKTASNFLRGNAEHFILDYEVSSDSNNGSTCRRLALSSDYVAGGFSDGAVRVFSIETKECLCVFKPTHESRIGPHSRTIAGLTLDDDQVVFASMDGSLFIGNIARGSHRRVLFGNYVNDGILVDFTGTNTWWVGLYAGVLGHALHIWNASSEDLMFNGGDMTDADAYEGWHLLVDNADHIGRVRISQDKLVVVATRTKLCVMDMETFGVLFNMQGPGQMLCGSLGVNEDRILIVSSNGTARVLRSTTLEEMARFYIRLVSQDAIVYGAMNSWHVFLCNNGAIDIWATSSGLYLYGLPERLGEVNDLVASDQCVACCGRDEGIHLWDFSQ